MSVYNQQDYVAQAIQSVVDQTVRDWELIVIDDGSKDRSGEIMEEYAGRDARIRVHHQSNAGLAKARNTAAGLAQSAWLTYLDSDDVWFPNALEAYDSYLKQNPQARFLYGYYHRLQDNRVEELPGEHQNRITGTKELFLRVFLNPMCVCHQVELWRQAGGFDGSLRYCDDYDLFLRMSLQCRFEPIGKVIGLRRRHGANMSSQSGRSQETEAKVLRRFVEEHGGGALLDPAIVRQRLGRIYYRAARQFLKEGRYRQSGEMAKEARFFHPSLKGAIVDWAGRFLGSIREDRES